MKRLLASEIRRRRGGRVNAARLRATREADIRRYIREDDGLELKRERARIVYNPPLPDVRGIRQKLGLSQAEFAARFRLSLRTIQQWEQGRAIPDRPARILLYVIARDPTAVDHALAASAR